MNKFFLMLVAVLLVGLGTSQAARVSFSFTNSLGNPDTNYFTVTMIEDRVAANGSFTTKGTPTRLYPRADGRITNSFQQAHYSVSNLYTKAGFLIRVPDDASSTVYEATKGIESGGLAISGYNRFITIDPTFYGVTNALGYTPATNGSSSGSGGDVSGALSSGTNNAAFTNSVTLNGIGLANTNDIFAKVTNSAAFYIQTAKGRIPGQYGVFDAPFTNLWSATVDAQDFSTAVLPYGDYLETNKLEALGYRNFKGQGRLASHFYYADRTPGGPSPTSIDIPQYNFSDMSLHMSQNPGVTNATWFNAYTGQTNKFTDLDIHAGSDVVLNDETFAGWMEFYNCNIYAQYDHFLNFNESSWAEGLKLVNTRLEHDSRNRAYHVSTGYLNPDTLFATTIFDNFTMVFIYDTNTASGCGWGFNNKPVTNYNVYWKDVFMDFQRLTNISAATIGTPQTVYDRLRTNTGNKVFMQNVSWIMPDGARYTIDTTTNRIFGSLVVSNGAITVNTSNTIASGGSRLNGVGFTNSAFDFGFGGGGGTADGWLFGETLQLRRSAQVKLEWAFLDADTFQIDDKVNNFGVAQYNFASQRWFFTDVDVDSISGNGSGITSINSENIAQRVLTNLNSNPFVLWTNPAVANSPNATINTAGTITITNPIAANGPSFSVTTNGNIKNSGIFTNLGLMSVGGELHAAQVLRFTTASSAYIIPVSAQPLIVQSSAGVVIENSAAKLTFNALSAGNPQIRQSGGNLVLGDGTGAGTTNSLIVVGSIIATNGFISYATNNILGASVLGYTNSSVAPGTGGTNSMMARVNGTSGTIEFYNRSGAGGQTVCGIGVWTNTIDATHKPPFKVGVNQGFVVRTGVGVDVKVYSE